MLLLSESTTELVRARWARAKGLGLSRAADGYPVGTSDSDLAARRDRLEDTLRGEHSLLDPISAELAGSRLVAIVADREGVILSAHADRHGVDPAARVRLVAGARWGEETRGTNAIGTALVEGKPVAVIGSAHFEHRNRELFCFATPVRDAYGDIVAVLDVSGPLPAFDPNIGVAVQSAGIALERALRIVAWGDARAGALAAVERLVHRSLDPALVVDASGHVRTLNAAARDALALTGSAPGCERIFGVGFPDLVTMGARPGGARFETRRGVFRLTIDPVSGAHDRPLAAVVHFSRERAPHRVPVRTESDPFDGILGTDARLCEAKTRASRFAVTSLPILLLAETGTGKELFARAIHKASARAAGPFVAINCGALSPELIAAELFGYAPGAFTGAARGGSEGRIQAASGGTLFLDEIAEMPESLQAALLRVLEDGSYQRVGEARERRADFRLICATCRDLPAMVGRRAFRNDLYYRIHGASLVIPALRERSDVLWLARRLLSTASRGEPPELAECALQYLQEHDFPGNVRELKSALAHALALALDSPEIRREHLPDVIVPRQPPSAHPPTRDTILKQAIDEALRASGGNVSEAARRLGVSRGTVYRAIKH